MVKSRDPRRRPERSGPPGTAARPSARIDLEGEEDDLDGDDLDDVRDAEFVEGSDEARRTLLKWLRSIADGPDCEQGFRATLVIAGASRKTSGQDKTIRRFSYELDMDLDAFVKDIVDYADGVVREFRREVRFGLRIALGGRPAERKYFTLSIEHEDFDDDNHFDRANDYTPDVTGLIAQTQSHTEVMAREMVGLSRESNENLRTIIRELRAENRELKDENRTLRSEREEVRDMQWARDDAREERRYEREQRERLMRGMMQGGKYLLATLAGGALPGGLPLPGMGGGAPPGPAMFGSVGAAGPQQTAAGPRPSAEDGQRTAEGCRDELHHAIVVTIGDFFGEATSEQVQGLVASGIFPPEQLERIAQLHKIYFALKEREEAARAHAPPPPPNGGGHAPGP